jgi:hypothetical protein
MSDTSDKPERDWVKEPYNTWDTLAAMIPISPQATATDTRRLEERLRVVEGKLDLILKKLDESGTP